MKAKVFLVYMYIFGLIFWIFFPKITQAVSVTTPTSYLPGAPGVNTPVETKIENSLLPGMIAYAIGVVSVLAVIAITWAGIKMFLSVGDEAKFKEARWILIYALVGVGVAGIAYGIVSLISNFNF